MKKSHIEIIGPDSDWDIPIELDRLVQLLNELGCFQRLIRERGGPRVDSFHHRFRPSFGFGGTTEWRR
jgi:hypothetical protein